MDVQFCEILETFALELPRLLPGTVLLNENYKEYAKQTKACIALS